MSELNIQVQMSSLRIAFKCTMYTYLTEAQNPQYVPNFDFSLINKKRSYR